MTNQPLVSVLMTVYNREKYLAEAIESVMASTYQNWELIIVDDKSKDRSVEIAQSYASKNERIKVYTNERNLGDYPNRNKAASYAKGKYLKYLDADDLIYTHALEVMINSIEKFGEAGFALTMKAQDDSQPFPIMLSGREAYEYHYFKEGIFGRSPLSAIIKAEAFEKIGGFSGKQHIGDFEIWHKLALNYPVVLMTGGLGWYRNHDDQQMNDNRTDPLVPFKYYFISMKYVRKINSLPVTVKEKILKKIRRSIYKYIISHVRTGKIQTAIKLLQIYNNNKFPYFEQ